jgi:NAD(P)-dependent dehydrogenase (short-subunit alcohol dehydrogenase family)
MKTAIVTGAAGGIGAATCTALSQSGYRVFGIDRAPIGPDVECEPLEFDIALLATPAGDAFVQKLKVMVGGRVAVLVNNAAVQIVKPFEALTVADWHQSLQVNLLAPFWLIQQLTPELRAGRGSVVNIASIHAEVTKAHFAAYSTTKGALVALTRALALELAPAVRVNAILPAATDTAMLRAGFAGNEDGFAALDACHPLGRIARPDEIASLAVFLGSSQSGFLTGEAIRIDGGIGAVLHDPASDTAAHAATTDTTNASRAVAMSGAHETAN